MRLWFLQQSLLFSLQEEDEEEDGEEDEEDEAEEGESSPNNPISCRVKYVVFFGASSASVQGCCCCSFSAQADAEVCHHQGSHREGRGFQDLQIPTMPGNSGKWERSVSCKSSSGS